jgi:hypothetical protein
MGDEGDESGLWTEVVSKKKKKADVSRKNMADAFLNMNLDGKQSERMLEKLTLFTKSKLVKQ